MRVSRWLCVGLALWSCAAPKTGSRPEQRVVAPAAPSLTPPAPPEPIRACAAAAGVETPASPELDESAGPSLNNLRRWVQVLAGPELRGRAATTVDALRAARLIADHFASAGALAPAGSDHCQPFSVAGERRDVNVIGHLPAAGARCHVVIGAHFDALGLDARGRIRPGADDNATGVSVLLELARLWSAPGNRPRVGVVLAAFGAEEIGLLGSAAYVAAPSVPLADVRLYVNVDMAGRRLRGNPGLGYEASGPGRLAVVGQVHRAAFRSAVPVVAMKLGDRGDNASFSPHVPTVFFCTTVHEDYHQPTDTPERVDYDQTLRAVRIIKDLVEHLDCGD